MSDQKLSSISYLEKLRQRRREKIASNQSGVGQPSLQQQSAESWQSVENQQPVENQQALPVQPIADRPMTDRSPEPPLTQPLDQTSDYQQTDLSSTDTNRYLPEDYRLQESKIAPHMMRPLPEEDILVWQAPSRPFKKHNKQFFTTISIIALLIALIFILAGQGVLPAAVALSVAFLVYVLYSIPPQEITNKISTYGVRVENSLYYWEELGRFWFDQKYGQKILQIETARFPGRITLLLANQPEETLKLILSEVLLNKKPDPTFFEKAAHWLGEKIPLEFD